MPVTANFSEQFYQTFGHAPVKELVDWCNQVDVSYRSEFRDLFGANFALIDAKFDQRIAEVRGDFARLEARMEQRLADAKSELRLETAELRGEILAGLAGVESRLTMRMFLFWIATVGIFFAQKFFS